ncbi:MAG: histidine kinase, partial [Alphaproteobacteria bacterium]
MNSPTPTPDTPRPVRLRRRMQWLWLDWRSLTFRLVAASALWIIVFLAAGGTLIARMFETNIVQNFDARLTQFIESMIGASELTGDGQVRFTRPLGDQRFFEPYSGWYWQVDTPGQPSFRSRSLWDQTLALDLAEPAFTERITRQTGPDEQVLRVAERDVYLPDAKQVFRFAVAGDVSELDRQIARFRLILAWSLGALGAGLIAALVIQIAYGLRPLRAVRRELSAIRTG